MGGRRLNGVLRCLLELEDGSVISVMWFIFCDINIVLRLCDKVLDICE